MNKSCIYRKNSIYKNFASVIFDHKIKYSDIENAKINNLSLIKNSLEKKEENYTVNFSLNHDLVNFTEGNFSIKLKNSPMYNTSYNFTLGNSNNDTESIEFKDILQRLVTITGNKTSSGGNITFLFSENLNNYTISNLKAASFKDIIFNKYPDNTIKNDSYGYHYEYYVNTSESGYSIINFEICGATFNTRPIKFVQNITDATEYLKFTKMLFLIILLF